MLLLEKELSIFSDGTKKYFLDRVGTGERVTALALRYDSKKKVVYCKLSDRVNGILPISMVIPGQLKEVYENFSNSLYYPQVASIIGTTIGVCIVSYNYGDELFVLSRKDSIAMAYEELKKCEYIYAQVKSFSTVAMYLDCSYGVAGRVYINESSLCKIRKVSDSFNIGDVIKCKIIEYDDENKRVTLSRRLAVEEENKIFTEGDIVYGKIREEFSDVNDSEGQKSYFFEILPYNVSAMINTFNSDEKLEYNDRVVCSITKIKEGNKYKARIIKRLI